MQASSFMISTYPIFIYPIESAKCEKKEKKLQKFGYLKKEELFR